MAAASGIFSNRSVRLWLQGVLPQVWFERHRDLRLPGNKKECLMLGTPMKRSFRNTLQPGGLKWGDATPSKINLYSNAVYRAQRIRTCLSTAQAPDAGSSAAA